MVSHPETGSDSPIGSDQESGRDTTEPCKICVLCSCFFSPILITIVARFTTTTINV